MKKVENVAFRDKAIHKYYFIVSSLLLILGILGVIFLGSEDINLTKIILLIVLSLSFILFNLGLLLSPKIAITATENGLIIRKLFKKTFISYENFSHASAKLRITNYHRDDNALVFYHNKRNDIGTIYIVYNIASGISKTVSLFSILDAQAVELLLNSLKK